MNKFEKFKKDALVEHILLGEPITILESIVLFGIPNLTALIAQLRRQGFVINSKRIPYIKALVRVNKYANVTTPKNLPTKEIMLTEYQVSI